MEFDMQRLTMKMLCLSAGIAVNAFSVAAEGPSFDCRKVQKDSIEAQICADPALSALDRKLAEVYAAASAKAKNEHPPTLKAEQRGWVKGRNDCWKASDKRECIEFAYRNRIVELQARYRLVEASPATYYTCNGNPKDEVVVTFFRTDPPSLIAERGDSTSLMIVQPSGSGSRYKGRNESFWEHQGEASVVWGFEAPEMKCRKK
jgi:uncharacterized protein